MRPLVLTGLLLGASMWSGCYAVDHFPGDDARYDGLFFGPRQTVDAHEVDEHWRIYALLGVVPWQESTTTWAGRRLGGMREEDRPARIAVRTQMTFLNGLAAWGVSLVTFGWGPLLFVPRTTEVVVHRRAVPGGSGGR